MQIEYIVAIISVAGIICSIVFGYIGYKRGLEKSYQEMGKESGTLKTDMEYIKRRIDDILLEQKETNKSINALAERVTRLEESTKQAHKRIDALEKNMKEI